MPYRTQASDTLTEAELFQLALLREAGPQRRLKQARTLSASTRQMSWQTLRKLQPSLSLLEAAIVFVELIYGKLLALELAQTLDKRKLQSSENISVYEGPTQMLSPDIVAALTPVIETFNRLQIPYLIGGSVASSLLGIPRSTNDADLVADLHPDQITPLITALQNEYYLSETAIQEALARKSSFNLIHLATMLKVDVFILKNEPFDKAAFSRTIRSSLLEGEVTAPLVNIASPEDMVLQKLVWYRAGSEISEKQWLDVLGILKMQGTANLDLTYMRVWANQLNVNDLLDRVLAEVAR